ncbi:hypothetical protein ACLKA6_000267 [Drosophila palustris]
MGSSKPQGKAEQRSHQKTVMQTAKDSGTENDNKMVCYKCKGDHQLGKCDAYLKATVAEKWAMAKELGVCYGCLHRGHSMTSCKFTRACNLNGCKKNHHRTLHNDQRKDDAKPEVEETQEVALNTVTSCKPQILFKVLPVQVVGPNKKVINTFAFIDEGSSASLINEKLADQIGVNVDKTKLTLNWIGKHATDVMSMECQFKIRAQENKKWMRINDNTVPELQLPLQSVDVNGLKEKFGKLRNIPIKGYRNADPMLLIGINNIPLVATIKSVALGSHMVAAKSALGWYIYGLTSAQPEISSVLSVVLHAHPNDADLERDMHKMMTEYFTTEGFGVKVPDKPLESADIIRARKILLDTTKKLDGAYETGLLWTEDMVQFPDSYNMALKRLHGVENLIRKTGKTEEYHQAVMDFVNKGYAVKLSKQEASVVDASTWNKHYVDDFVASFESEKEAYEISNEVKEVHKLANFDLRGFVSNSMDIEERLNNATGQLPKATVNIDREKVDKILGMHWESQSDEFVFKLQLNRVDKDIINATKCPTKRQLLSLVMSVYDPFGMLADLMVHGKVLIQDVWKTGIGWNDLIPDGLYERFKQWISQLDNVKHFKLERCYSLHFLDPAVKIDLHVFVDASKTKCAPLKMLSVPRRAASRSVGNTTEEFDYGKPQRKCRQRHFMVRLEDGENDWRWIPSHLNAADKATKAPRNMKYTPGNIWTKGPEFLLTDERNWPSTALESNLDDSLERKKVVFTVQQELLFDMDRFSNYLRLKRTFSWILRFIKRLRHQNVPDACGELTANELRLAEVLLCKLAQNQAYSNEISSLRNTETVPKSSPIYSLCPKLTDEGILVVYGRLDYATDIPERARQPIILPTGHTLTNLVVKWYHDIFHHQNDELIINEIRRKFWIINLRQAVKRAKTNCQYCKNKRAIPRPPLMGQLPKDRVTPYQRPFSYVGLDYFGPVMVTIGRRHEKRWVALFTCLTIRAMHLELAADLSTDSCILCIRNFVNRRGVPVKIRSDMGTNFVGANNELMKTKDLFDWNNIKSELSNKGINWEFNCPSNPSSGGCWERLVRSTKRVLAITLKEQAPQVETLRSLLIEAENIVNSRPLTHIPVDIDDPEPLTPNHFLLGTTNSTQTPGDDENFCYRKQYRIAKQLKDKFWKRWLREYLPTITRRTKWNSRTKSISVGVVVIICEDNLPRGSWKKGIIIQTLPAKDGQISVERLYEFINNVEDMLMLIRGADQTPNGLLALRAIRHRERQTRHYS